MKNYIIIIVSLFLISSCTEPIDLKLNEGDNLKIVVDAWIDNSLRTQVVKLSLTTDYFDETTPDQASGAEVILEGPDRDYLFTESSPGVYEMTENFEASIGSRFTLRINYEGTEYTATETLKRVPDAAEYFAEFYEFDEDTDEPIYDFYISTIEPAGKGDYYFFNTFKKGNTPILEIGNGGFESDEFFDNANVVEAYITDGVYNPGDTVVVQTRSIAEAAYNYLEALSQQTVDRGFIFDTPPANVPTNISGNARGFFILSAVHEGEVIIP